MNTPSIKIKDGSGPVKFLEFQIPPGVTVVRGRNGQGKTETMKAAETALRGKGKLSVRDGCERGTVEAFGVTLKIMRTTRSTGECEVDSLEGRLDLAQLVDPGIKDPEAADLRRVKALVSLGDVKLTLNDFVGLAADQEEFDRIVPAGLIPPSFDSVSLAEAVKRQFEKAARAAGNVAKSEEFAAGVCRQAAEGMDLDRESREDILADEYEDAAATETRLRTEKRERELAAAEREKARISLAAVERPNVKAAFDRLREAVEAKNTALKRSQDAVAAVELAEKESVDAVAAYAVARDAAFAASDSAKEAEKLAASLADLETAAAVEVEPPPDDATIALATATKEEAGKAIANGALIRKAKDQIELAGHHERQTAVETFKSERLREAGRGIDNILSDAIPGDVLRMGQGPLQGRLCCHHPDRGQIPFAELSEGERYRVAIDLVIPHVKAGGIILVNQEAWQGLDPDNRADIAAYAEKRVVGILTAEATAGELRVERFKG